MIKFFRKIRQNVLTENKFSKYLLYAIGEILLIVIGILIALNINNKNEARKTNEFEIKMLRDIESSLQDNFWQADMGISNNKVSINSAEIILYHLEESLPYHDSLDYHFSKSIEWISTIFSSPAYESLKSYGMHLITNDSIRKNLAIYDWGWIETLGQRQEDYFYNTASPILTRLFEKVAMRTEMKPYDYDELKNSREYLSVLRTSKALREDQVYWYEEWRKSFKQLDKMIKWELKNKNKG